MIRAALRLLVALCLGLPIAAAAQEVECDPGDLEVRKLAFEGNRAFPDAELSQTVVTTASSKTQRFTRGVFGKRRCISVDEVARDQIRLAIYYRRRGFPKSTVDTVIARRSNERADITFRIHEGAPVVLDTFKILGLDAFPGRRQLVRDLPIAVGRPFDRKILGDAVDSLLTRLRNSGYPRADVELTDWKSDTTSMRAQATLTVIPGRFTRIGNVRIDVQSSAGKEQQIPTKVVERLLGLRRGRVYRERDLVQAQRNLYQLDAYQHVEVRLAPRDSQPPAPGDSLINIEAILIEGRMHSVSTSFGWGALDCFRAQATVTNNNFLGGGRHLELTGRLSKLGIGYPLRVGDANDAPLCHANAERDFYGDTVNYYLAATFQQPTFFGLGPRALPTITLFSKMESGYNAYFRSTPIGASATLTRSAFRVPVTFGYKFEYGRTEASAALFCAVFNVCDLAVQDSLKQNKRLAVASAALVRDRSDDPNNPTRGLVLRVEGRHASRAIGSDPTLKFNKILGDIAWYRSLTGGDGLILAGRIRGGAVLGSRLDFGGLLSAAEQFIPPEERLYAGGSTTVRGFRQNELGPAVYIARSNTIDTVPCLTCTGTDTVFYRVAAGSVEERVVPTGGNTMAVGNVELRVQSPIYPEFAQLTFFADVGEVWNRQGLQGLGFDQLKVTPGMGLRIFSIFGPIRLDVGYLPKRYDRPRGAIYFDEAISADNPDAALFCVSPRNEIPVVNGRQPAAYSCPETFLPNPPDGFWRRVTFNLSIGQAF